MTAETYWDYSSIVKKEGEMDMERDMGKPMRMITRAGITAGGKPYNSEHLRELKENKQDFNIFTQLHLLLRRLASKENI